MKSKSAAAKNEKNRKTAVKKTPKHGASASDSFGSSDNAEASEDRNLEPGQSAAWKIACYAPQTETPPQHHLN